MFFFFFFVFRFFVFPFPFSFLGRDFQQRNDEENLRVLFERVLDPSAMPPEKARVVWERFVQLELCMASTGGNLNKAEAVEARMRQVKDDWMDYWMDDWMDD